MAPVRSSHPEADEGFRPVRGTARPNHPRSDHYDGVRFFNPSGATNKSFLDLIKWRLLGRRAPRPAQVRNVAIPAVLNQAPIGELHLTFVNHATFLIQVDGWNILTDPVFSQRVSPFQSLGPSRVREPGLAMQDLPKIDLLLVSHNHYDHLDIQSLRAIARAHQPRVLTPLGNGPLLERQGLAGVTECDWWDVAEIGNGARVVATPAQHWSARGLLDRNRALWSGFIVETAEHKIYFAGDTGYAPHFKEIRARRGVMDLALLPIGAYEPRWFMKDQHMNPDDAVMAHLDLQTEQSIGMHFGAFQLTDEDFDAPVRELEAALRKHEAAHFDVMEVGETRRF